MMDDRNDKDFNDIPLAESNVSLKLADIQRRCSQLMQQPDALITLSLEDEPLAVKDSGNPYDRG